jgi:hypothetical protein
MQPVNRPKQPEREQLLELDFFKVLELTILSIKRAAQKGFQKLSSQNRA